MSLLPGVANLAHRGAFVSPLLFDEETIAVNARSPGRRVGCSACSRWMLQRDHALCQCEVPSYSDVGRVTTALRVPTAPLTPPLPPPRRLCAQCTAVRCGRYRPIACDIEPPQKWATAVGAGGAGTRALVEAATPAAGSPRMRAAPVRALGCAAAGFASMSEKECRLASGLDGYGRAWIGASTNSKEAPGCVLWEDGNVEFNRYAPPLAEQRCNIRGTCLCKSSDGREEQVIGTPPSFAAPGGAA
jgi:hypothetical protein